MPNRLPLRPLLLGLVLFLVCAFGLHKIHAHNASYRAYDLTLPDRTPARLVLPGPPGRSFRPSLPEDTPRPPLVVLTHGIIADKEMMSGIAHGLARHGVAVVTIDWLGHGANPLPFDRLRLQAQLHAVIQYMRDEFSHLIDPNRIGLMGHSMGAGASLGYGGTHPELDVTVAISGARLGQVGEGLPSNLLMIYAAGDLPGIADGVPEAMKELTGVVDPEHDVTYGQFAEGTARRMVEVPSTDHVSILFSAVTTKAIVQWVGEVWPLGEVRDFHDPRLPWLGVVFVTTLALTVVAVRLLLPWMPRLDEQPYDKPVVRLAAIVVAMVLALLAVPVGNPAGVVPILDGGRYFLAFFGTAGLLLLGYTTATGAADWRLFWPDWRGTVTGALLLALVFYVLVGGASDGVWLHMTLSPHRAPIWLWSLIPLAVFSVGLDALTKKGGLGQALLMSWAATVAMAAVLFVGVARGLSPFTVMLVLPITAVLALMLELPSLGIYAYTRNYFLTGLYRASILAVANAACWPTLS